MHRIYINRPAENGKVMMNYELRRYGGIQSFLLTIMHILEDADECHKVPELGQLDCRLRLTLLTCK
jgi:hypothetical protein